MRSVPSSFDEHVRAGGPLTLRVSSWLDGSRLKVGALDRLPIATQSWEISAVADAKTPGELRFEVPNQPEYWPTSATHPLAAYGQRLWAQIGYGNERVSAGWYRIVEEPEDNGSTLQVTARGLAYEIARARFLRGYQTDGTSSRLQTLQAIMPLPVVPDVGVIDRSLQAGMSWDEDRFDALVDITDTWPARWYVGDDGAIHVAPVWDDQDPGEPVFALRSGPGGNLVGLQQIRTGVADPPNGFRVANIPEGDEPEMVGVWTVPEGPMRWWGPYGQKPEYYSSPLLPASEAVLIETAKNMTMRAIRRKMTASAQITPDLRLQIGDVGTVASPRAGVVSLVRLTGYRLTPRSMSVDLSLLGGLPL